MSEDPTDEELQEGGHLIEAAKDVFASVVGSASCVYTGQPFDTVKVRMQVKPGEFSSAYECIAKTLKNEGVLALWRGSVPAVLGAVSENAVAFGVNGQIKRLLGIPKEFDADDSGDRIPSFHEPFLFGGITGFCTAFVLCPCDVLKCRAQTNIAHGLGSQSVTKLAKTLIKTQGLRGLYAGFGAQVIRDIPFYATFFGSYEVLCAMLKKHTSLPDTSVYFIAGGLAGQIGWTASIAPDVVKSRIQSSTPPEFLAQQLNAVQTKNGSSVVDRQVKPNSKKQLSFSELVLSQNTRKLYRPPGIREVVREVYRTAGIRGFFTGIEVAVVRAFPANAALFVGYELSRNFVA